MHSDKLNTNISSASVGWHIEHSLMTIEKISKAVIKSDPTAYKWSFRMPRFIVFTLNKIPRGKAKAPSVVQPISSATQDELIQHLNTINELLPELNKLESNKFFSHPYFGDLKLKKAIQCLEIHTHHHLKIIQDIVK
jgi:hypothetical protein